LVEFKLQYLFYAPVFLYLWYVAAATYEPLKPPFLALGAMPAGKMILTVSVLNCFYFSDDGLPPNCWLLVTIQTINITKKQSKALPYFHPFYLNTFFIKTKNALNVKM